MHDSSSNASAAVRSNCPDCEGLLRVLRVINGRAGAEYWTMRCTSCGGIHLDIVNGPTPAPSSAA
ncbi:MAG: hypothetical protein WA650_06820 [Bradyrhizobium sp.]